MKAAAAAETVAANTKAPAEVAAAVVEAEMEAAAELAAAAEAVAAAATSALAPTETSQLVAAEQFLKRLTHELLANDGDGQRVGWRS